jgi:hypothetical protein
VETDTKVAQRVPEALSDALEQRFNLVKDQFDQIDADADARITGWRYATDSAFELRAEFYRRFNQKPGTLIDDEPLDAYIYTAYGFDDQDRIICSAIFQSEDFPRIYDYYDYGDNYIDFAEFGYVWDTQTYRLSKVGRVVRSAEDRPLHYAEYSQEQGRKQLYFEGVQYDEAGRITRVSCVHQGYPEPLGDSLTEHIFEYDDHTLKRIVARGVARDAAPASPDYVMYEAPRPGDTPDSLFDAARSSLKSAIIEQLKGLDAAIREKGPFYNLIISYDAVADDGLLLLLNTEAQRQQWEQSTDDRSYGALQLDSLTGPQNAMLYAEIQHHPDDYARFLRENRRDEQWDRIRELLCAVARDLNDVDWSAHFQTTDDFIVFASDYEAMNDVEDDIRDCVPDSKLKLLRARGLID